MPETKIVPGLPLDVLRNAAEIITALQQLCDEYHSHIPDRITFTVEDDTGSAVILHFQFSAEGSQYLLAGYNE